MQDTRHRLTLSVGKRRLGEAEGLPAIYVLAAVEIIRLCVGCFAIYIGVGVAPTASQLLQHLLGR